jgi:selenocysteine-specific elongation factor
VLFAKALIRILASGQRLNRHLSVFCHYIYHFVDIGVFSGVAVHIKLAEALETPSRHKKMAAAEDTVDTKKKLELIRRGCGNKECSCGACGCPYGGCSCDTTLTSEEEDLGIGEIELDSKEVVVNVNIGVLGHVNSGKTSLVRALSKTLSTAALDKNPQSKERGMTLDLGFSSFATQAPPQFKGADKVQFTLVDCPGHASLIRTIIGGAQIIDRMLLVVDVTKGIQAQTAECLVIGEVLTDDMVIVLNKIDLIPPAERKETVEKMEKNLRKALASTKFADSPMVAIAAFVDGGDDHPHLKTGDEPPLQTHNLIELVKLLRDTTQPPVRALVDMPLYMSVDHCFPIKGQGTVLTGTILAGKVSVGDEVEIPDLGLTRKIKTIQRFHRSVPSAQHGDRASFAVSQLDAKKLERGVVCTPGSVPKACRIIGLIRKVKYFERACVSGSKIHVTVGPSTGLAKVTFFGSKELREVAKQAMGKKVPSEAGQILVGAEGTVKDWEFDSELKTGGKAAGGPVLQFVLMEFDHPVVCPPLVQLIGSRLDLNESLSINTCRIGFFGRLALVVPDAEPLDKYLRVYKNKERTGVVDRVDLPKNAGPEVKVDQLIGRGMFKKDSDISSFLNLKVLIQLRKNPNAPLPKEEDEEGGEEADGGKTSAGDYTDEAAGFIESSFGKTGKFKVGFRGQTTAARPGDRIVLRFKKYVIGGSTGKKEIVQ